MSDDDDKEGKDDKDDKELRMSFDPMTIGHLGGNMYSSLPSALAELIANAYDADASCVRINLHDNDSEKFIEVIDDGVGMTFVEINNKFLCIGRNRREEEETYSPSGNRKVTGKKGLGKLALFGIVQKINIETTQKGVDEKIIFEMDWDGIMNSKDAPYKPHFSRESCKPLEKGTKITLRDFKKRSSFDKEGLAISLSKLFVFFDEKFKCWLTLNDDKPMSVDKKLKYKNLPKQFSWAFPESAMDIEGDFEHKDKIHGEIISTEKPLIRSHLRGITLYANGRLVNAPEFFGGSESSHAYSYLTGWLEVDYIDDFDKDVISTNRQALVWENEEMDKLREFLSKIVRKIANEWREKREKEKEDGVKEYTGIDINEWTSKTPEDIGKEIKKVSRQLNKSEGVTKELAGSIMKSFHYIAPEYPELHWRHLHPEVQKISKPYYESEHYYTAFSEAAKHYVDTIQAHTQFNGDEDPIIANAFGNPQPKLNVTTKYTQTGAAFTEKTLKNIRKGQLLLSQGIWAGARHPMSHHKHIVLEGTELFTKKDCLDALSILSHLFRRLDDAIEFLDSQDKTP